VEDDILEEEKEDEENSSKTSDLKQRRKTFPILHIFIKPNDK
jgi:geranylgeranyl pyrophosphate synthase